MTKEEITPEQALGYLKVLVALDNSQIAKDTLDYFKELQQENEKQKKNLDILKPYIVIDDTDNEYKLIIGNLDYDITKEQYLSLKEWLDND